MKVQDTASLYNADYYERGTVLGISGYRDYRWIPELTIPMAHFIIRYLHLYPGDKVLDFGAAKGYLVKALRLLGMEAYGYDVSKYAVEHCHEDVRPYMSRTKYLAAPYQWILAKDVLQHIEEKELLPLLRKWLKYTAGVFVVVPLAHHGAYVIEEYAKDITHRICYSLEEWKDCFEKAGWNVKWSTTRIQGIKDNYATFEDGNGFFTLEKR